MLTEKELEDINIKKLRTMLRFYDLQLILTISIYIIDVCIFSTFESNEKYIPVIAILIELLLSLFTHYIHAKIVYVSILINALYPYLVFYVTTDNFGDLFMQYKGPIMKGF